MNECADPDRELSRRMGAAQDGDRAAYRTLLDDLLPILRRIVRARRPFLSNDDIEDVVQDIVLSLHSVRASYDCGRPFLPWLLAIANNRIADAGRRHARRATREVTVAEYPETSEADATNSVSEVYGDPEALHQAVAELPKGQRLAVELLKLREMTLKEAAAVSGMSIGALKVASHRATKALRLVLKARN